MRFFLGGRYSGKTTYMIMWLRANPDAVMMVHSNFEAARLEEENPDLVGRIIPPHAVLDGKLRGRRNLTIGIDNLDLILPHLFGGPIGPITATEPATWLDEEWNGNEDLLY